MENKKFKKVDKDSYESVNKFLKEYSLLTTREWMASEICKEFRDESTGRIPMTKVGKNIPEIFPFMEKDYAASEISNAKSALRDKVVRAGTTFIYAIEKGTFSDDEFKKVIFEVANNLESLSEVMDGDLPTGVAEALPKELNEVFSMINKAREEDLEDVELNEPLFGEFIGGNLGENWKERVDTEYGEMEIKIEFERNLLANDILVPEKVKGEIKDEEEGNGEGSGCKLLDLDHGHAYWYKENEDIVKRYKVSMV